MPRRPPHELRAAGTGRQDDGAVSTLLVSTCPGPPVCRAVHTYLFVDGLDVIARSDDRMVGLGPDLLLRPGGPLCPTDAPREVEVAAEAGPEPGPDRLTVRIRLRGGTVVWSGLAYPGPGGDPVEEIRFHLTQYLAEIERAGAAARERPANSPPGSPG
ncbi:hypothetical protein [Streptomyces sp. NPDC004324]